MSISDRLKRMKDLGTSPGTGGAPTVGADALRTLEIPGWDRSGDFLMARDIAEPALIGTRFDSRIASLADQESNRLCFIDTETTGLSTGAGSLAFLFGVGTIAGESFVVKQIFLLDYPGEVDFLDAIEEALPVDPIFVSYNGSSFDLPLLRSRFALKRRMFPTGTQIDLLHVARRFWQRKIGSCSLTDIEREIFEIERVGDIPGSEIPDRYFEFLRVGEPSLLDLVFDHHHKDITTLQRLFVHCEEQLCEPIRADIDHHRVGNWLLRRGDRSGRSLLQLAFDSGNARAGLDLASILRRDGDYDGSFRIWDKMWQEGANPIAGVEMAKYWEHRRREYRNAIDLVEKILVDPRTLKAPERRPYSRVSLHHRRKRLLRRVGLE